MKRKELPFIKKLSSIDFYSKVLLRIWVAGIAISLVTFLYLVFFQTSGYSFDLSVEGFSGFLTIFEFPIKLLTASVVLFGLWLTIKRMEQTDLQIESITSNNRFNNFYKHREEFLKNFQEFKFLEKIEKCHQHHIDNTRVPPGRKVHVNIDSDLALKLYQTFFYKKAKNFTDAMNETAKMYINKFTTILSELPMENDYEIDYDSIDKEDLSEMMNNIPGEITKLTTTLARLDSVNIEHSAHNLMGIPFFTKLNIIYWFAIILYELLEYDGVESEDIRMFLIHYNALREEKGLYT